MMEPIWESSSMRAFEEQVRRSANLSSSAEASQVARSTLTTLAESISAGEVDQLTQGLPRELQLELSQRSGQARAMDKNGFLDRVSGEITTTDLEATEKQVRAVLRTLKEWAPQGEVDDAVKQLRKPLAELFR